MRRKKVFTHDRFFCRCVGYIPILTRGTLKNGSAVRKFAVFTILSHVRNKVIKMSTKSFYYNQQERHKFDSAAYCTHTHPEGRENKTIDSYK